MPAKRSTPAAPAPAPQVRFRLRVTQGDVIAIGPGKVALLEQIDATGSITAAAKSLGMSYRRAWLLVDELNRSLRQPAVDSTKGGAVGGGTRLTDDGRAVVALYRRIERTAEQGAAADIGALTALLAPL